MSTAVELARFVGENRQTMRAVDEGMQETAELFGDKMVMKFKGKLEICGEGLSMPKGSWYKYRRFLNEETGEVVQISSVGVGSKIDSYIQSGLRAEFFFARTGPELILYAINTDGRSVNDLPTAAAAINAVQQAGRSLTLAAICMVPVFGFGLLLLPMAAKQRKIAKQCATEEEIRKLLAS